MNATSVGAAGQVRPPDAGSAPGGFRRAGKPLEIARAISEVLGRASSLRSADLLPPERESNVGAADLLPAELADGADRAVQDLAAAGDALDAAIAAIDAAPPDAGIALGRARRASAARREARSPPPRGSAGGRHSAYTRAALARPQRPCRQPGGVLRVVASTELGYESFVNTRRAHG
jgi:hypothetical protein